MLLVTNRHRPMNTLLPYRVSVYFDGSVTPISVKAGRVAILRKRDRGFWCETTACTICQAVSNVFLKKVSPQTIVVNSTLLMVLACIRIVDESLRAFWMNLSSPFGGHEKHCTHGMTCFIIGKAPLHTDKNSWPTNSLFWTHQFFWPENWFYQPPVWNQRSWPTNVSGPLSNHQTVVRLSLNQVFRNPGIFLVLKK